MTVIQATKHSNSERQNYESVYKRGTTDGSKRMLSTYTQDMHTKFTAVVSDDNHAMSMTLIISGCQGISASPRYTAR